MYLFTQVLQLYLLTMSFLPQLKQTNRYLGARLTRIGEARKFNEQQVTWQHLE